MRHQRAKQARAQWFAIRDLSDDMPVYELDKKGKVIGKYVNGKFVDHYDSDDEEKFDPLPKLSKEWRFAVADELLKNTWFSKESVAWEKRMLGEDDKEKPAGGLDLFNLSSSDDDIMQMIEKHQREEAEKAAAEEAKKPEVIEVSDSTDLF